MDEYAYGVEMTDDQLTAFLAETGDGVLSFGGRPGYAIPVSFGYDAPNRRFVFQFVFAPESTKREYVEADEEVTLVAYDWASPDDWESVVASGRLVPIERASDAETAAASVYAEYATPVGMTVFERPAADLDPQWFELRVEEVHGRQSPLRSA